MKPFEMLTAAMAYATFDDDQIEQGVEKLIAELDNDLERAEYSQGELVEKATATLEEALNTVDAREDTEDSSDDESEEDTE